MRTILNYMIRPILAICVFLVMLLPGSYLVAQDAVVRRIAAVSTIAIDEYALGVSGGTVVNQREYDEAALFLAGIAGAVESLEDDQTKLVAEAYVDSLRSGVRAVIDAGDLADIVTRFREKLASVAGIELDPFPDRAPSLEEGAALFATACAQCHGPLGGGDGHQAEYLDPLPANLADVEEMGGATPLDFYRFIGVGVAGTSMPPFEDSYSAEQRWSLALYASTLRSSASIDNGRRFLRDECAGCEVEFSGIETTAGMSDDSLAFLIALRTGLAAGSDRVNEAVAYARLVSAAEELGDDRIMAFRRVIERTRTGIAAAASLAVEGDSEGAFRLVFDAYLVFEEVEAMVMAISPSSATDVEVGFADLRPAMASGDEQLITTRATALNDALSRTVSIVSATSDVRVLFGKSLLIIVREGMEAILIVGALTAFLFKAGVPERKRDIGWGVAAAVAASFGTAILFATVFSQALQSQELIEGITMLVAAAVLFWVSYWLVSKIEMKRWQAFVRNKMGKALGSGSRAALVFVAFLAVYREGFETVLFYSALYASADGSSAGIASVTTGMVVGFVVLAGVYVAIQRFGVKIPLKPFFAGTSALLYVMAFSFVGQGIAELQASGSVAITPLGWVPTVPMLGIFPTAQTIVIQLLMAFAVVMALVWVFWWSPRFATPETTP